MEQTHTLVAHHFKMNVVLVATSPQPQTLHFYFSYTNK